MSIEGQRESEGSVEALEAERKNDVEKERVWKGRGTLQS